jgi:hypothetical protein
MFLGEVAPPKQHAVDEMVDARMKRVEPDAESELGRSCTSAMPTANKKSPPSVTVREATSKIAGQRSGASTTVRVRLPR